MTAASPTRVEIAGLALALIVFPPWFAGAGVRRNAKGLVQVSRYGIRGIKMIENVDAM